MKVLNLVRGEKDVLLSRVLYVLRNGAGVPCGYCVLNDIAVLFHGERRCNLNLTALNKMRATMN